MKNSYHQQTSRPNPFLIPSCVLCDFFLCDHVGLKRFLHGVDAPPFLGFNVLCNQRNTFFTLLAPLDLKSYRHLLVEPRIKSLALIKKKGVILEKQLYVLRRLVYSTAQCFAGKVQNVH